jgi:hypothetical protein
MTIQQEELPMKKLALLAALASTALLTAPAMAASVFDPVTDTVSLDATDPLLWVVSYDATAGTGLADTSSLIAFRFLGTDPTQTTWNFDFRILNTSGAQSPLSELAAFGFDSTGTETGISTATGARFDGALNKGNFNGLGTFDVCLYAGPNCNGGGSNGVAKSEGIFGPETFSLTYNSPLSSQVLSDFVARWQVTGPNGGGSASGLGQIVPAGVPTPFDVSPVPEPATWGMMLVGFGLLGGALRRRRPDSVRVRYS